MKYLRIAILLAGIFSVPAIRAQEKPGTRIPQQKKTSPEKSSAPSEKKKPAAQSDTGKSDATEAAASIPPLSKEDRFATSIALALSIGTQAEVEDPLDKIRIMLESAKLLSKTKPNNSSFIVAQAADLLLERKKNEQSENAQARIAALERELIALSSKLDPEKTEKFIHDSLDATEENIRKGSANNTTLAPKARAEKMAELASILIENGIPAGVDLLLKSVADTGRVASTFVRPFRTSVLDSGMKTILSARIKQAFAGKIVAEPNELSMLATPVIGITARDDSCSTINAAILDLELNSLKHIEATLRTAREQERPIPYNNNALDNLCGLFASRLRALYSRWLPEKVKEVDLCLKNIQELVSFKIGERSERAQAETVQEKIEKAVRMANGPERERELINLAFDVLTKAIADEGLTRDQAMDKILAALNSNESKELVKDAKVVTEIKEIARQKNFIQVAQKARQISRPEWRAQALAGAASGLDKTDPESADLLYQEALGDLNNSRPGTAVIRTAMRIAERYYERDLSLGRQILHFAVQSANQTKFSEKGFRFAFDRTLTATIGSSTLILGFEPERIQDALREFNFPKIARLDWQPLYEISFLIENKMLRYMFQLKMCEAAISQTSEDSPKAR